MGEPLIVGAGPTGLSAAIELARRGISARIVDRSADFSAESRAIGINPRTLHLLEASGVTPRLLEAGIRIERSNLRFPGGRVATIEFGRLGGRYPFMVALPQSRTERILGAVLSELGVVVEQRTSFVDGEEREGRALCSLDAKGERKEAETSLLLAADGASSSVRKAFGVEFPGDALERDWMLTDVAIDWPYRENELNIWAHPVGFLFAIALGGGLWRFVSDRADPEDLLPAGLRPERTVWKSSFRVEHRQVPSYRRGPVFFAGDAAHIHSPLGARGMNMGIADAATLAWLISEGREAEYHTRRHPVAKRTIARVKRQTLQATRANRGRLALARWLAPPALRLGFVNDTAARFIAGLDEPTPPWLGEAAATS